MLPVPDEPAPHPRRPRRATRLGLLLAMLLGVVVFALQRGEQAAELEPVPPGAAGAARDRAGFRPGSPAGTGAWPQGVAWGAGEGRSAREAPPAETRCPIEVRGAAGEPVAGATVELWDLSGRRLPVGTTDEWGRLEAGFALAWRGIVRADHPLRGAAQRRLSEAPRALVVLTLADPWTLEGHVLTPQGNPAPQETVLMAFARDGPWPTGVAEILPWVRRSEGLDASGRFRIDGLEPGRIYKVWAWAPGWAHDRQPLEVSQASGTVSLVLRPLYGVTLCLRDARGGPLRVPPGLHYADGVGGGVLRMLDPTVRLLPNADWYAGFWGEGSLPEGCIRKLVTTDSEQPYAGPLEYAVEPVGYEPKQALAFAQRWIPGSELVLDVLLDPVADDWSSLRLRLVGGELDAGPGALGTTAVQPPWILHLRSLESGRPLRLPLRFDGEGLADLELPAGSYSGWIEHHRTWRAPSQGEWTFDLVGGALEHAIDVGGATRLEVQLVRADGSPYLGPAGLRIARDGERRAGREVFFRSAPYVVAALGAGEWRIGALTEAEFSPPGQEPFQGGLVAVPGESSRLVLEEDPRTPPAGRSSD